jgi:hypothetical protein
VDSRKVFFSRQKDRIKVGGTSLSFITIIKLSSTPSEWLRSKVLQHGLGMGQKAMEESHYPAANLNAEMSRLANS